MAVIQRPLKGSRISSFYPVKSLPPLSALDSAFQLQEYISLLIRTDVHDVEAIVSLPGKLQGTEREGSDEEKDAEKDGKGEVTPDESCWVYEQLRRLAQDLTHPLITTLQHECTRQTCPEMKAGEWLYLCVAHGNEGAMEQCCAIDYILHTLDSATALLNSPRAFPSRLSIPPTSTRHFSSLARRLGRIFAHAYYHHREAFEQAEAESSLYARFLALTSKFNLVPSEFLVIPPRLASLDDDTTHDRDEHPSASEHPQQQQDPRQWLSMSDSSSVINLSTTGSNSPTPDLARSASPRKVGRSRTDTMVYSEAAGLAEELARSESRDFTTEDLDRAIAAERMLSAVPQGLQDDSLESMASGPAAQEQEHAAEPETHTEHEPKEEHEHALSEELEPELHLDLSAPAPTEPAIPTDVDEEEEQEEEAGEGEEEEDITEESNAAAVSPEPPAEAAPPVEEPKEKEEAESEASEEEPEEAVKEHVNVEEGHSDDKEPAAEHEAKEVVEDVKVEDATAEAEDEVKETRSPETEEPPVAEADVVEHAEQSKEEAVPELEAASKPKEEDTPSPAAAGETS
ncbi:Mob1/phocein [Irpex lacteus]|nr:Mob1/phocein [Irpex lacteus]